MVNGYLSMADDIQLPEGFTLDQPVETSTQPSANSALPDGFQLDEDKYGGVGQQIATGLEGAASSATFGASTGIEKALHIAKPEDIRARREQNPIAHGIGQVAGLAIPAAIDALTGGAATPEIAAGEAAEFAPAAARAMNPLSAQSVMSKLGEKVAKASGLGGADAGLSSQMGHAAVRGAIETSLFQGGDEISKMLSDDPNQSVQTAAANIGLAGILGAGLSGGIGAVSPIWKATSESKVGQLVLDFKNRTLEYLNEAHSPTLPVETSPIPEAPVAAETPPSISRLRTTPSEGPIPNFPPPPGTPLTFKGKIPKPEIAPPSLSETPYKGPIPNFPPPPGTPLMSSAIEAPVAAEVGTTTSIPATNRLSTGAKLADLFIEQGVLKKLTAAGLGSSVGALIGKVTGIGGGLGALLGEHALSPFFNSVLPALIKPILSTAENAEALKSATDFGLVISKGANLITKASQNIFKPGAEVLANGLTNDEKLQKLDDKVKALGENQEKLMHVGGQLGHYLPAHGTSLAATATGAVNYLNAQRPKTTKAAPLDNEQPIASYQKAAYNRTLSIAASPLTVLHHLKEGTLIPKDLSDLNALYPGLHQKLQSSVGEALIDHVSKNETIPYHTKMSLSLFTGQPLDGTMIPANIQSIQATYASAKMQGPQQGKAERAKRGTAPLSKTSEAYLTPNQAREASRSDEK